MCTCGDIYCPSCGSAQGNFQCQHCGAWSIDGGCENPQKCINADNQYAQCMAEDYQWELDNAEKIAAAIRS